MSFGKMLWCLGILAVLAASLFSPGSAIAYSVGSGFGTACHERISARAMDVIVQAMDPQELEALEVPDDEVLEGFMRMAEKKGRAGGLQFTRKQNFLLVSLLIGARYPDTDGHSVTSLQDLRLIHGDPSNEGQYRHCLRGLEDNYAAGNQTALDGAKKIIIDTIQYGWDYGKDHGSDYVTAEVYLDFYGIVPVKVLAMPYYFGAALHTFQDCFSHTLRTDADGLHSVVTVMNFIDAISPSFHEEEDGLAHSKTLDDCMLEEASELTQAVTDASVELAEASVNLGLHGERNAALLLPTLNRWMGLVPGCTMANHYCHNYRWEEIARDEQTEPYMEEVFGCSVPGRSGSASGLAIMGMGLALLGLVRVGRRRVLLSLARSCVVVLAAGVLLTASPAVAQVEVVPEAAEIKVDWGVELPLTGIGYLFWTAPMLFRDELYSEQPVGVLDKGTVNPLDRAFMGRPSSDARLASDILAGAIPAAVVATAAVYLPINGWAATLDDMLIVGESVALAGVSHQLTRHAFRRPRPYMYEDGHSQARNNVEDLNSFFSGHTAAVFAAAASYSMLFNYRHPESEWGWLPWAAGMTMGSAMAFSRVYAQDHFLTDVAVGAAVGIGWGILLPWMHVSKATSTKGISCLPVVSSDFFGVSISL